MTRPRPGERQTQEEPGPGGDLAFGAALSQRLCLGFLARHAFLHGMLPCAARERRAAAADLGDHFAIVLGVRYYDLTVEGSGGEELEVNPLVSRVGAGWRW